MAALFEAASVMQLLQYEVLSYTGEDVSLPRIPCRLNGYEHAVTVNLEAVVKKLRGRTRKRYLWVDALCIYSYRTAMS